MAVPAMIRPPDRRVILAWLGIAGVAVWTYAPVFQVYFLNEDFTWLWRCRIRSGLSWWDVLTRDVMSGIYSWRPLVQFSMALNEWLSGLDPTSYRLETLVWHLVATAEILLIGRQVSGLLAGIVAAALFAVHPLQVESLAWTCARGGPMAVTFCCATVLAHLAWRQRRISGVGVLVPFVCALGTQETAVMMIPILGAADFVWGRSQRSRREGVSLYAGLLLVVFLAAASRAARSPAGVLVPLGGVTALVPRLVAMAGKLRDSAGMMCTTGAGTGLLILAGLACAALWRWKRGHPAAIWGAIWMLVALAPYLTFLFGPFPRYFPLPLVGLGILVGDVMAGFRGPGLASGRRMERWAVTAVVLAWMCWAAFLSRSALEPFKERSDLTRRFLAEVQRLVPDPQKDATFAFYRVGELRVHGQVFVFGLEDAIRTVYRDGTLRVEFPELGKGKGATYHLLYDAGHLQRLFL